jgi:hypothetical protein
VRRGLLVRADGQPGAPSDREPRPAPGRVLPQRLRSAGDAALADRPRACGAQDPAPGAAHIARGDRHCRHGLLVHHEASALAPLEYAKLPFAALYGIALFAEVPDLYTLLGAALIVLSTLFIGRREAQLGKRPAVPRANAEV